MKKRFLVSFLTILLVLSTVLPLNAGAAEETSTTETIIMDGEKITFERELKDGIRKVTIRNDKGEVLSEASLDLTTNEAVLDGVKLSNNELEDIVEFGNELEDLDNDSTLIEEPEPTNTISPMAANSCTYKQIGKTKKKTTWIPKTGVASIAGILIIVAPGIGLKAAMTVASVVAGSSNTAYYTVKEYSCSKGGVYYLKTTRSFYKKSNYTGHIYTFSVYGSRR